MQFYTYIYRNPDTLEPFYVGKGCRNRAWCHLTNVKSKLKFHHTVRKLLKDGTPPIIEVIIALDENHAHLIEECLIEIFGRADLGLGPLLNLTNGGEGGAFRKLSTEHKAKISAALKGRKADEQARQNMRTAQKGHFQKPHTEEAKAKISKAGLGRKHSIEARFKMSLAQMGKSKPKHTDETKAKMSLAHKGIKRKSFTPEHRANIAASARKRKTQKCGV